MANPLDHRRSLIIGVGTAGCATQIKCEYAAVAIHSEIQERNALRALRTNRVGIQLVAIEMGKQPVLPDRPGIEVRHA
jgi:hypothetical protein